MAQKILHGVVAFLVGVIWGLPELIFGKDPKPNGARFAPVGGTEIGVQPDDPGAD